MGISKLVRRLSGVSMFPVTEKANVLPGLKIHVGDCPVTVGRSLLQQEDNSNLKTAILVIQPLNALHGLSWRLNVDG